MGERRAREKRSRGLDPKFGEEDGQAVDLLLRVASGPDFCPDFKREMLVQMAVETRLNVTHDDLLRLHAEFEPLVQMAIDAPDQLYERAFAVRLRELAQGGMIPKIGSAWTRSGKQRLTNYSMYRDIHAMLSHGLLLLLDEQAPYGRTLCRCKLPTCHRFYLAKRNPKGGPANRTYCTPEHRDEHHDSAQRKEAPMNRPVAEHFSDIAKAVFPKQADIVRADKGGGDLRLLIDWRVGDLNRPNKRSKSIELRISRDAMSDYANSNERQQKAADRQLRQQLRGKLSTFNPNHDAPAHVVPPREEWIIGTADINS